MNYELKFLEDKFQEISEGKSPEEFLKEKCPQLIHTFLQAGRNAYRQVGPYWEALKIILEKYAPEEYKKLNNLAGGLDTVNNDVLKAYACGSDELDFVAALQYMQMRYETMAEPNSPHFIEINGEETAYIPNYMLDQNLYHGRE